MISKVCKIGQVLERKFITFLEPINGKVYRRLYKNYLRKIGVDINIGGGYIAPSVWFDGTDYSLISVGARTTISKDVILLTHDYSIDRGLYLKGINEKYIFLKPIRIGDNCFVGARSILLPGTVVGDNCIIGAGSVVKGKIPNNSVVCGNPARVICSIDEFTKRHLDRKDFIKVNNDNN